MHLHHYSCVFFFFDPFSWIFTLFSLVFMTFPLIIPIFVFFFFVFTCPGVFILGYMYVYAPNLCYTFDCDRFCGQLSTFGKIMVRSRGDEFYAICRFPFIFPYDPCGNSKMLRFWLTRQNYL